MKLFSCRTDFIPYMHGWFLSLINPVHMFQMAIVSALYFSSFTTFRGSWGSTFPLENNALFLHLLLVSQKVLKDKFCRVLPCQQRAQQYWDLQVMKLHQRESTTTNRSQVKVLGWFRSFFSRPVSVPPSCRYCSIAIRGSSQRYQKRPPLWGGCSLSPMAVARWGLHGGDKATRWNSELPGALWGWGPSWCHIAVSTADLTGGGGVKKEWGTALCCRSPLHPVVSSAAFGSPIAIPSNASGGGEVTQPRVIKRCASLSLSPFYSQ